MYFHFHCIYGEVRQRIFVAFSNMATYFHSICSRVSQQNDKHLWRCAPMHLHCIFQHGNVFPMHLPVMAISYMSTYFQCISGGIRQRILSPLSCNCNMVKYFQWANAFALHFPVRRTFFYMPTYFHCICNGVRQRIFIAFGGGRQRISIAFSNTATYLHGICGGGQPKQYHCIFKHTISNTKSTHFICPCWPSSVTTFLVGWWCRQC